MPSNHKRNTEGLWQHAARKKEQSVKRVDEAIRQLIKDKQHITFNSVAQVSGVAKSYLYSNQDIRSRIETLRKQQEGVSPKQVKQEMTDSRKDVLLAVKNQRIQELEDENNRLKRELQRLRGQLYKEGL
ncbi:transposase [Bacillus wiedmannii]|uniref:Transposase n=1 Tax=Bacillus wiedmannii TaxID=1890302 RepID=A0A4U2MD70_9BACI|nr:DUF6262 family protein [Bacillus wiedmannii]TKH08364.1 transposase [Bacillus wiedmannii]TKI98665.1 transposase [Bacillus wiedmannii]